MQFGELVKELQPGQRVKISIHGSFTREGKRIWSNTLTDAQMLAYWTHTVIRHKTVGDTVACILEKPAEAETRAEDEAPGV